jgi:hypothetical protein
VAVFGFTLTDDAVDDFSGGITAMSDMLAVSSDTIDAAEQVMEITSEALVSVDVALVEFEQGMGDMELVLEDMSSLVGTDLADSLGSLRDAMPRLVQVGDYLDNILEALSFFGVPYDEELSVGDSFREVAASIALVPERLQSQGDLLLAARDDLVEARTGVLAVSESLAELQTELDATSELFIRYRETVAEATEVVDAADGNVGEIRGVAPWLVIALGVMIALWQAIPLYLGYRLRKFGSL